MEKKREGIPALLGSGRSDAFRLANRALRRLWSRSYRATWPKNVLIAWALFLVMSFRIISILIMGRESPFQVMCEQDVE